LNCSFCGKSQQEVKKLIAGPTVYICDECVGICNDVIAEEQAREPAPRPAAPTVDELLAAFGERVTGNVEATRALVAALRHHRHNTDQGASASRVRAMRVLLVGPSGSGKTTLGRALCEVAGPVSRLADVGGLSESGYVGDDVEHLVASLLGAADQDIERAQRGVLFLDGVEKLAARRPLSPRGRDISGEEVQRELLRLLDGTVLNVPYHTSRHPSVARQDVATEHILVAAAVRLEDGALPPEADDREVRDALCQSGLLAAFVARFDRIVRLRPPTAADLRSILTRRGGLIDRIAQALAPLNATLEVTPDAVDELSTTAVGAPDGAWVLDRALRRQLTEVFLVPDPARAFRVDRALARRLLAG
jgi:ATP-dependent protease Clp ATPase subunit